MKLRALIEQSDKECIVIASPAVNKSVLQELSKHKVFKPLMFMHKQDLIEKVLFKMEDRALHEASVFFDLKPRVVKPWLRLLYLIDDQDYASEKLNKLVALKKHLMAKSLLSDYPHKESLFNDKNIYVALDEDDAILRKVYAYLDTVAKVHYVQGDVVFKQPMTHIHAHHIGDELAYVAHEIRRLHEEGVPLKQMAVSTDNRYYQTTMKRVFKQFEIPFDHKEDTPLWALPIAQRFYQAFCTQNETSYEAFKSALEDVQPKRHDEQLLRSYRKLVHLANRYAHLDLTVEACAPMLLDALKTSLVFKPVLESAIRVGSLLTMDVSNVHYLFHVGASESYFPPFKTEDDYLNRDEKQMIGMETADEENAKRKTTLKRKLASVPHVTLSESLQSASEQFFKAAFIDELAEQAEIETRSLPSLLHQPYAKSYDRLRAAIARDAYVTYGESSEALKVLYPRFLGDLKQYDNRFNGLAKPTLDRLLPSSLRLSYTRLNTFFKCRFHYMLDGLLKLDPDEDNLNKDLGSFFHEALERYIKEPALIDGALEAMLKILKKERPTYTKREWFFLRESIKHLNQVFDVIKTQHERSDYSLNKQEKFVEKPFKDATLVGIIDQLMTRKTESDTKWVLLDYKTGSPTLYLKHALHGLNVQLLYYVLLLQSTFEGSNDQITGFYEQTLLMRPKKVKPDESLQTLFENHLTWQGFTLEDRDEVYRIDREADDGSFIQSFRTKKDGDLSKSFKTYTPEQLSLLVRHLETLINEAIETIRQGDFTINPKKDGQKDLSCTYCPFRDVCYRQERDYQSLDIPKNEEALFEALKKRGDES